MARVREISHDGFDKRNKKFKHKKKSNFSENVAFSKGISNPESTAVNGWIKSPGHRKNMLAKNNLCAIAMYETLDGSFYSCQLFANTM
jgi:uncharacterized protein YkwD